MCSLFSPWNVSIFVIQDEKDFKESLGKSKSPAAPVSWSSVCREAVDLGKRQNSALPLRWRQGWCKTWDFLWVLRKLGHAPPHSPSRALKNNKAISDGMWNLRHGSKAEFLCKRNLLGDDGKVFVVGLFHAEFLKEERAQMNSFNFSQIYGNESYEADREESDSVAC